jgi:4a-hydroxytetrahydrobiopterin dehydratase
MPMSLAEINKKIEKLNGWNLEGNMRILTKEFIFEDFAAAMRFVNEIAAIAEEQEHHPDIMIAYKRVRLSLTTHDENGLTNKDFELAEAIDEIASL